MKIEANRAQSHDPPSRTRRRLPTFIQPVLPQFDPANPGSHTIIILAASIITRIFTALLINLCTTWIRLPLFDSSPLVETKSALLRWDVFHFVHIAALGGTPEWEHEIAFSAPGLSYITNAFVAAMNLLRYKNDHATLRDILILGSWAVSVIGVFVPITLYKLTVEITGAPAFALCASLLYCLPSSPPTTLYAGYTEPVFAFFAFNGMRHAVRNELWKAAVQFAIAQSFRSSGVLLWAFPIWYQLAEPALKRLISDIKHVRPFMITRRTDLYILSVGLAVISLPVALLVLELALQRFTSLKDFCTTTRMRPWCFDGEWTHWTSYAFVQEHYWNVGFLRYWEPAQIPNFLISAPIYAMNFFYCSKNIESGLQGYFGNPSYAFGKPFLPFALHGLGYSLILFFTAHVQIMLRQVSNLPITYWGATALLSGQFGERGRFWGRAWVTWSV
ncbi:hypothetical protein DACRYDRAFT_100401, partial [Dacryopinax primogenitus]